MNWLYRINQFMAGRRGADQLTVGLLVLYFIVVLISNLTRLPLFWFLGLAILIFAFYRMFSRNLWRRQQENDWFLKYWNRVSGWFRRSSGQFKNWQQHETDRSRDKQFHRYYKCPNCKNTLRVPKGRGKIKITCPVCGTEFVKKT